MRTVDRLTHNTACTIGRICLQHVIEIRLGTIYDALLATQRNVAMTHVILNAPLGGNVLPNEL